MTDMTTSWIKMMRTDSTVELLKNQKEFSLLANIALRAKRTDSLSTIGLNAGEVLIRGCRDVGMSDRQYRTCKTNLEKWGFTTSRPTSKGTVIKIIDSSVFDINMDAGDEQRDTRPTSRRRAGDEHYIYKNDKNDKNDKKKTYMSDSDEYRLANLLLEEIRSHLPDFKPPDLQVWAKSIDAMIRLDHRTPADIEAVIRWCQIDSFWRANILSPKKLRDKFDALRIRMNGHDQHQAAVIPLHHKSKRMMTVPAPKKDGSPIQWAPDSHHVL